MNQKMNKHILEHIQNGLLKPLEDINENFFTDQNKASYIEEGLIPLNNFRIDEAVQKNFKEIYEHLNKLIKEVKALEFHFKKKIK